MEAAVVVVGLLVLGVVFYFNWRGSILRRADAFKRVAASLAGGIFTHEKNLSLPTGGTFRGTGSLHDRQVSVELAPLAKSNDQGQLRYEVVVPEVACEFHITSAGLLTRVKRKLGLASDENDELPDRSFVLKSSNPRVMARLFQEDGFESALVASLRGLGFVQLSGGRLSALRATPLGKELDSHALLDTLTRLTRLAELCQAPTVEIVLREKGQAREGSGPAGLLCPYCRDQLDLTSEDVTSCSECLTFHHCSCMEEAGGCTIFGCGNRHPRSVEA